MTQHVIRIVHVIEEVTVEQLERLRKEAPLPMIAARIKRARTTWPEDGTKRDWSHDYLGDLMGGVSRRTLIGYEKREHRPTMRMLERIAEATGREVRWFVDPELDQSPFQENERAA